MFYALKARRKLKAATNARIAYLEKHIADAWAFDYKVEPEVERQIIDQQTRWEENELASIRQARLRGKAHRIGLKIPAEHFEDNYDWRMRSVLTSDGEGWVRREWRKHIDARIEFYAKIVLPIASIIISVIALLKKH